MNESSDGRGQSATKRFVFTTWRDGDDHEVCVHAGGEQPSRTPIAGRTGVATAKWLVVDRHEGYQLICNRLHSQHCEWPWAVTHSTLVEPVPGEEP
jgi:hypothetical protein